MPCAAERARSFHDPFMAESNKTEQPTPRRRQKAREKGQVARSRELTGALALMAAVICLGIHPMAWEEGWGDLMAKLLDAATTTELNPQSPIFHWTLWTTARWLAPIMAATFFVSLIGATAQGGVVFSPKALIPNFSRLSPATNLGRFFSVEALRNTLKSLIPMVVILYMAGATIVSDWGGLIQTIHMTPRASIRLVLSMAYQISWKSGMVFLIWGGMDHLLQRFNLNRQLRMSREEVREESKETEGNPATKVRIKRAQRQIKRRLMMDRIRKATVVVTNPTHYAVALEYQPGEMDAPRVVGKGRNLIAQRIREEAERHGVPIVENPPLAQALYKAVEIGQAIPPQLYAAVAEILAFIFRAQARAQAAARMAQPRPTTGAQSDARSGAQPRFTN